jgi:MFS family permease
LGGIVLISGLLAKPLVNDSAELQPAVKGGYWQQVFALLRWHTIRENPELFLLFLASMIAGTAGQVNLPYLFIYLENSIGLSKTTIGLSILLLTLISGTFVILMGLFLDRWDRKRTAIIAGIIATLMTVVFSQLRSLTSILILGTFYMAPGLIFGIVVGAWIMDLYPKDEHGSFQGMRMIFQVMLPMVIGPQIGSWVIAQFGVPTAMNGEAGFIPTHHIFVATALVNILALIPILVTRKRKEVVGQN